DAAISAWFNYGELIGDFIVEIDVVDIINDSADHTPLLGLVVADVKCSEIWTSPECNNAYSILHSKDYSQYKMRINRVVNNVVIGEPYGVIGGEPTKFRVKRVGTTLSGWYKYAGTWYEYSSYDFTTHASKIIYVGVMMADAGNHGGYCDFDNLIITPSVRDDYDGVINDIVDLTYDHESLDGGSVYCYEITAQSNGIESEPSDETYGIPELDIPANVSFAPGLYENIISWDDSSGATSYNIYWDTAPGVDKDTARKIENVTSPYTHTFLDPDETYYYVVTAVNDVTESSISTEVSGMPTELNSPISPAATPDVNKNSITWKPGPPNEYFDGDLSNWIVTAVQGTETATIVDGKLVFDINSGIVAAVDALYKYMPQSTDDYDMSIGIDDYLADNVNEGLNVEFRILSETNNDFVRMEFFRDTSTVYKINAYAYFNSITETNIYQNVSTCPVKMRIKRTGTTFYWYYDIGSGWVELAHYDAGTRAPDVNIIRLKAHHRSSNGGSVKLDNVTIIPGKSYFPNDTFENSKRWYNYSVLGSGTTTNTSGKIRNTIPDNVDEFISNAFRYSIPQGDFSLEIDLADYSAHDTSNGIKAYFFAHCWPFASGNIANISYYVSNDGATHNIASLLKVNGNENLVTTTIAGQPSKFKITRVGSVLTTYYYIDSWIQVHTRDFTIYADEIHTPYMVTAHNNNHGGFVEFDNLTLDKGISSYNLYWKKDKIPNCYFYNDDDWTYTVGIGGATAQLVNNAMRLDVPGGVDGGIYTYYNHDVQSGDFIGTVDIKEYSPDDSAYSLNIGLRFKTNPIPPEGVYGIYIWYSVENNQRKIRTRKVVSGVTTDYDTYGIANEPTKFRIERNSTYLKTSYYMDNFWVEHQSLDFGVDVDIPNQLQLSVNDNNLRGGSVDFDNLIITPSVKDSGNKISGINDLTYDHEFLDPGHVYCYEITAGAGGESKPSLETYGIPQELNTPSQPTGLNVTPGVAKNIISWDALPDADSYNLYWATTPGVTVDTATKIEAVTSPYSHYVPTVEEYYYIVTAVKMAGESDPSDEVAGLPIPPNSINIMEGGSTSSLEVHLFLFSHDATEMMISEDPEFVDAVWEPYLEEKIFTLSAQEGEHTLYVTFRNAEQEESEVVTATIMVDTTAPPEVDTLSVTPSDDGTSVSLDWSGYDESGAGDIASYRIYAETSLITNVSGLIEKASVSVGQFTYEVQGLERDTLYYFVIVAVDTSGNVIETVTIPPASCMTTDIQAPEDVTNLQVESFKNRLVFFWELATNTAGDLAGYRVYFDGDQAGITLPPDQSIYTAVSLNPDTDYDFTIKAYDDNDNESDGVSIIGHTLDEDSVRPIIVTITHEKIDEDLTDFPVMIHLSEESGTNSFDAGALFDELKIGIDATDAFTTLLLHMDDTSLTDVMGNTVTKLGDVARSMTQSKFGGYSAYFDGAGDYLTIPYTDDFNLSTSDWTLEAWFYSNSFAAPSCIVSKDTYGINFDWCIRLMNATTIGLYSNRTTTALTVTVPTMNTGEWYHVAAVRHDGTNIIYLNGFRYGSNTMTISNSSQSYVTVGCQSWNNPNCLFNGYIDELRVSKGIARWTSNFTPAHYPYGDDTKKFAIYDQNKDQCYTEIEEWDDSNKEAWLWVKVPAISSTHDTALMIHYSKNISDNIDYIGAIGEVPAQHVWDNNFSGVWHMSQDPSGGSDAIKNSTNSNNHGTSYGSITSDNLVDGLIGRAIWFDGIDDKITLSSNVNFGSHHSLSWVGKSDNIENQQIISGSSCTDRLRISDADIAVQYDQDPTSQSWAVAHNADITQLHAYDVLWNGTSVHLYVDGVLSDSTTTIEETISVYNIGGKDFDTAWSHYNGFIDDLTLSDVVRPAAWIKAKYYSNFDDLLSYDYSDDTTPPPAVGADTLIVNDEGDGNTIILDWSGYDEEGVGDVAYYKIYRETSDFTDTSSLTPHAMVDKGILTYTVTGLNEGVSYYIAVVAVDYFGNALTTVTASIGVPTVL
ncbi:MAG: LamG-like jellyroll fold domain-containing protein, partial [bacterium]